MNALDWNIKAAFTAGLVQNYLRTPNPDFTTEAQRAQS
jgi:hypothetical protein